MKTAIAIIMKYKMYLSLLLILTFGLSLQAQPVIQIRSDFEREQFYQHREKDAPIEIKLQIAEMRGEINRLNLSYTVGYTAVLNRPEWQLLGEKNEMPVHQVNAIKTKMQAQPLEFTLLPDTDGIPSAYDARDNGWISPVADQGGCGSCWAFAAVAMYESNYLKRNNILPNASEQHALNCGGGSCSGGLSWEVFEWMVDNNKNLKTEAALPYAGSKSTCPSGSAGTNYYATSWKVLRPDGNISKIANPDLIKTAIMQYGAVKSSLIASGWSGYTSGVLDGYPSNFANPSSNHAILIIGWDDSKQAFLIKNSWGTDWGYDGFGWVKYGHFNIGRRAIVVNAKQAYKPVAKILRGNDNGLYYVREIGNTVFWFGETATGGFANVFTGTRAGNIIKGTWADVPKGGAKNNGNLIVKVSSSGQKLTKVSQTGGFSCNVWNSVTLPANAYGKKPAGFAASTITNLDGLWKCNDSGSYYVNQVGSKVFWFGEAAFNSGRPAFANVAVGKRVGNTLTLKWADVPKCGMTGKGTLKLKVTDAQHMVKQSGSGFGGTKWTRTGTPQVSEDCISFNPDNITITADNRIVDGSKSMFAFPNRTEAQKAVNMIKKYGLNQSCYVGRPGPSFTYLLKDGKSPAGVFNGEDCLAFVPSKLFIKKEGSKYKLTDGTSSIMIFPNKTEADKTLAIIKKYGFTNTCYIGRPDPSLTYMRKDMLIMRPAKVKPIYKKPINF